MTDCGEGYVREGDALRRSISQSRASRSRKREIGELRVDLEARLQELEESVDALTRACGGMLHMLRRSGSWDEEEFDRFLSETGMEDGEHDTETTGDGEEL